MAKQGGILIPPFFASNAATAKSEINDFDELTARIRPFQANPSIQLLNRYRNAGGSGPIPRGRKYGARESTRIFVQLAFQSYEHRRQVLIEKWGTTDQNRRVFPTQRKPLTKRFSTDQINHGTRIGEPIQKSPQMKMYSGRSRAISATGGRVECSRCW